jgi:1-aminocyclopropane-1-carboxylate deaminase
VPSDETNDAIRLAARTEAMITDPVYEGKSMQGLIDLTRKGFFPDGSKILYAHLGGAPAINGYSYYYKDDGVPTRPQPATSSKPGESAPQETLPPLFP